MKKVLNNKKLPHSLNFTFALTLLTVTFSIAALPLPSWVSKAPLKKKPSMIGTDLAEILPQPIQTTIVDRKAVDDTIASFQTSGSSASFAVIVFDPWVPWEVDCHYLEIAPTLNNAAFVVSQNLSIDPFPAASNQLVIKHLRTNCEILAEGNWQTEAAVAQWYITALKGAIYAQSSEIFLPLTNNVAWIGNTLISPEFKQLMHDYGLHINLIYTADHKNRDAESDFAFFDQLLQLSDEINHTHYRTNRPIRYFVLSYLKWAYQYAAEKAAGEVKPETELGLHHLAEQMMIMLKKLV